MELNPMTRALLIGTQEEIKRNDFNEAYAKVLDSINYFGDVGLYTEALLKADVDPLRYTTKIPPFYLSGVKMPDYVVHATKDISTGAFWDAILNRVIIEGNINVDWKAFKGATLKLVCSPNMAKQYLDIWVKDINAYSGIELEQV